LTLSQTRYTFSQKVIVRVLQLLMCQREIQEEISVWSEKPYFTWWL